MSFSLKTLTDAEMAKVAEEGKQILYVPPKDSVVVEGRCYMPFIPPKHCTICILAGLGANALTIATMTGYETIVGTKHFDAMPVLSFCPDHCKEVADFICSKANAVNKARIDASVSEKTSSYSFPVRRTQDPCCFSYAYRGAKNTCVIDTARFKENSELRIRGHEITNFLLEHTASSCREGHTVSRVQCARDGD